MHFMAKLFSVWRPILLGATHPLNFFCWCISLPLHLESRHVCASQVFCTTAQNWRGTYCCDYVIWTSPYSPVKGRWMVTERMPFLQGVSIACYQSLELATVGMSVRLSVHLSHAGTVSKRRKLGSRNLRRLIGLYSLGDRKFIQKFERVHPSEGVKIMRVG